MKYVALDALTARLAGLPGRPRVVVSGNVATPWRAVEALDRALPTYVLNILNGAPGVPTRDGVIAETCFVGSGQRHHPALSYVPCRLSMVPVLLHRRLRPDVVIVHCAPARNGYLSMGIEVNVLPAAIETVRAHGGLVVAVINKHMPYTYGDALLAESDVDLAVEVDEPLPVALATTPDDASAAIGATLAAMVPNGATLQTGIGMVPDATLAALADRRELRVWTEMFSDGVLALEREGALDTDVPLTTSFVFGSQELYDWIDGNRRVMMQRTERTNDPALIARQRTMVSINTALQVDLFGQANASRINGRIHSGFGGQTDFIVGAMHSHGGHSFIALRSWHPKADVSTIVPRLLDTTTSFQQSAIVTEQGVARLLGNDEKQQAAEIIEHAAHPDVRDELRSAAAELGLDNPLY
ncbi:acetyl-CoA hydrolase/transferase family protein [Yimella sp. cx-51]|uniref:acetyl-CoA hydrolase/transferase family protein n=1 Tax=Yimella sp. cx-51 TaxID=2770551 RepID=UPI00165DF75C|nr:acetyl-CoA hydrolase/transferase C-terminal domain-containing protein [Yimella sp. cx-51]MBC9958154.1 acetyl-CoA hydrolase [Yimella sp. cx-51]QTH38809.1 acetyl-CoA hydrolase [Yimella sp. cx-51]